MDAHQINFLQLLNGQVQYVVPRWQRRYCWGQSDIQRLVEDLLSVSDLGPDAAHYGGTLITFQEHGAAGVVNTIRVIDGQQRLTTVSILLGCIAHKLGREGRCGDWTAQIIRDDRLTNPGKAPDKCRKLRLQDGDDEEYRSGLEGNPSGPGAVTQAWRIAKRLVDRNDVDALLRGLSRLRVVSIGLRDREDPQQIFESLNATGRPLTESEKVKNWLLMGLPDAEQQDLHDNHWLRMERSLKSKHATERSDVFLRDVLRWRTGQTHGIDRVYEGLRRWAVHSGDYRDKAALCRELARLADLYGILTGKAGAHRDAAVERQLRHLRAMRIHVHRPLTLRLLNDADGGDRADGDDAALAKTLAGIGAWITRMWLADRPTAGMNKAIAELAHGPGPSASQEFAEYWIGRICRLRASRVGVPGDDEVREGIRTRKAYGGSATRSAFAILCALMEAKRPDEAPSRRHLTVEHVMPQKLTGKWKGELGEEAEEIHGSYRHRIANLTLCGDITNPSMGASPFVAKRKVYQGSSIYMNRCIADESKWDRAAMDRRAEDIARWALDLWPWVDQPAEGGTDTGNAATFTWRVGDGPWYSENTASQLILDVAAALLSMDPANARKLSGEAISSNLHRADKYPPGSKAGTLIMRAVPRHKEYVLYPYGQDYLTSAERCRDMGKRCGVAIDVEVKDDSRNRAFWRFFRDHCGGVPGQKDSWRGPSQRTDYLNDSGESVGIYIGNPDLIWLYIKARERKASARTAMRMRRLSWIIRERMGDQKLGDDIDKNSAKGWSISVQRAWVREDEDDWPAAAQWIKEQYERLQTILVGQGREDS